MTPSRAQTFIPPKNTQQNAHQPQDRRLRRSWGWKIDINQENLRGRTAQRNLLCAVCNSGGGRGEINEFNQRCRSVIPTTYAGFQHPCIPTVARRETASDIPKQNLQGSLVLDVTRRKPAGVNIASLTKRNQTLRERTKCLRLSRGGLIPTMLELCRGKVPHHCASMSSCAT